MSLKFVPYVLQTVPKNNATNVSLKSDIRVVFNMDMDPASFEGNLVVQTATGGNKVNGTISYKDRVVTFTPDSPFEPGTAYVVIIKGDTDFDDEHISGVRSILQYPMAGVHTFTFTTAATGKLPPPTLKAPLDAVVAGEGLMFMWDTVEGAVSYKVEIGLSPQLDSLIWESYVTSSSVIPNTVLPEGNYFWRVQALDGDGNTGLWSEVAAFAVSLDLTADLPYIPGEQYHPLDPPEPQIEIPALSYNVDPEIEKIVVFLPVRYAAEDISVQLMGTSLDGNVSKNHDTVDVSIEIKADDVSSGVKLYITLQEGLKPNQVYKLIIKTPSSASTFSFVTQITPLYSSFEQLQADTGLTEDEMDIVTILRFLFQASLICNDILENEGKKIPEEPTFVMRQFTRYRAARDVVMTGLRRATYGGRGIVKQRLADLQVERRPQPLMMEIQATLRDLEKELAYWENRLKNRSPIVSATRGGRSNPYPLAPRT